MHISAIFIRRPIATSLLMTAIALFGVIAYRGLAVSDLPAVDYPTVNVQAAPLGVFVLIYNYEAASGLQTALQWTGWSRTFSIWDCLQMCDPGPCPPPINPPGTEIIAVAFTGCVTGPALVSVGRIFFVPAGNAGCITQSDPGLPLGIHLLDCEGGWDQITDPESPRLGKICVNAGGVNACAGAVPVESATWGRIKATY